MRRKARVEPLESLDRLERSKVDHAAEMVHQLAGLDVLACVAEDQFPFNEKKFRGLVKVLELEAEVALATIASWCAYEMRLATGLGAQPLSVEPPAEIYCRVQLEGPHALPVWSTPVRQRPTVSFQVFSDELALKCRSEIAPRDMRALIDHVRSLCCSMQGNDVLWDEMCQLASSEDS